MAYTPNVIDLCTLADVREYINALGTQQHADDDVLQRLITSVSQGIANYCSRQFLAQQITENRNGRNEIAMTVKWSPIYVVSSVSIDGTAVTQSTSPTVAGWVNDERMVYLRSGVYTGFAPQIFCCGILNVQIVYWAGWQTPGQVALAVTFPSGIVPPPLPLDIQQACVETVMLANRQRTRLGDQSIGVGPERITYFLKSMSDASRETLGRYQNSAFPIT